MHRCASGSSTPLAQTYARILNLWKSRYPARGFSQRARRESLAGGTARARRGEDRPGESTPISLTGATSPLRAGLETNYPRVCPAAMNRYLTYAMAGTVGLISAWLHDGRSEPVEEMRSLLGRVILGKARNGSLRMQVSAARSPTVRPTLPTSQVSRACAGTRLVRTLRRCCRGAPSRSISAANQRDCAAQCRYGPSRRCGPG